MDFIFFSLLLLFNSSYCFNRFQLNGTSGSVVIIYFIFTILFHFLFGFLNIWCDGRQRPESVVRVVLFCTSSIQMPIYSSSLDNSKDCWSFLCKKKAKQGTACLRQKRKGTYWQSWLECADQKVLYRSSGLFPNNVYIYIVLIFILISFVVSYRDLVADVRYLQKALLLFLYGYFLFISVDCWFFFPWCLHSSPP